MKSVFENWTWETPARWTRVTTLDMHTGGEPLRVITSGLPSIKGRSVLEKRRYFKENYDHIRTGLMFEPRGHADMYGAILTPSEDADFDVFFIHNEGYSTMCGHAILALAKLVVEAGLAEGPEIAFNVPAGRNKLIEYGRRIKHAVMAQFPHRTSVREGPELSVWDDLHRCGLGSGASQPQRGIFAEGEVDRSPTGSGVSARAALHHAKGQLELDQEITIESILGSTMTARAVQQTTFGPHAAVIPEVSGSAHVTGRNEFYFDPEDPFRGGFIFR